MGWAKGRPRPRKVGGESPAIEMVEAGGEAPPIVVPLTREENGVQVPIDWRKGALLNVRNRGDAYVITLYPEESHPDHPERELRFTNVGDCQNFVSDWYSRQSHDPRAR